MIHNHKLIRLSVLLWVLAMIPRGISGTILRRLSFVGLIALSPTVRNEVVLRSNFETFDFESDS